MIQIPQWQPNLAGRPKIAACGFASHGMQGLVENYRLENLWCMHLYRYVGTLTMGSARMDIRPGGLSVAAPDTPLEYRYYGPSRHLFVHFRLPAGGRNTGANESRTVPAMQHLPAEEERHFGRGFEECIGYFPTNPARAEVRLWDLLWQATDLAAKEDASPGSSTHGERAVAAARQQIEARLGENISIEQLAESVELSHNHLTRLFRAQTGGTVTEYIQRRRVERALHLLQDTTLPAKAVASQIGVPDLQAFNKLLRRHTGSSPRALRSGQLRRRNLVPD